LIACVIFCSRTVLPVRGGATTSARCPLPIGATRSTIRVSMCFGLGLEHEPLLGVQRRQVLEVHQVVDRPRVSPVDVLDPQQREVPLALLGRADRAADVIPRRSPNRRIWLGET
jgi:hypothetical protein